MGMEMSKFRGMARNERGMTLIELLAVVVILGILATVAAVAVVNASDKAKVNADSTTISVLKDAAQRYIMEDGTKAMEDAMKGSAGLTINAEDLIGGLYIRDIPKDSAGYVFSSLNVKVDTVANKITWTFDGKDASNATVVFAPRATNK